MPKLEACFLSSEQIRSLASRALEALTRLQSSPEEEEEYDIGAHLAHYREQQEGILETLRFCAVQARLLKDPSLLPLLSLLVDAIGPFDSLAAPHHHVVGEGIKALLLSRAPLTEEVRALARHAKDMLRAAVAGGLRLEDSPSRALLEVLAQDPSPYVRNVAKERLSAIKEISWWQGKFSRDPAEGRSEEALSLLKPIFERLSVLADTPLSAKRDQSKIEELTSLAAQLPEDLRKDFISLTLSDYEATQYTLLVPLGVLLLDMEEGAKALLSLLEGWFRRGDAYGCGDSIAKMLLPLTEERKLLVCRELLAFALSAPGKMRNTLDDNPYCAAAAAVGKGWPPLADATEVLDALLASPPPPEGESDFITSELKKVFENPALNATPFLPRVISARLLGFPGAWSRFSFAMTHLLSRAPREVLKPAVEQALESQDPQLVTWGIGQMLGRPHELSSAQEGHAPDKGQILEKLLSAARYRGLILASDSLRRQALPHLRKDLREGRLGFEEALLVMGTIREIFGGFLPFPWRSSRSSYRERLQRELSSAWEPSLKGPPTEEEWRHYRAARVDHLAKEPGNWADALFCLREPPFTLEDREYLHLAKEGWHQSQSREDGEHLAYVLSLNPIRADLAVLDEIIAKSSRPRIPKLLRYKEEALYKLGLSAPGESVNREEPRAGEWMDEPEEDDL